MEHRLGRTLRVFLIALSAAGFYRLAIVPWVEPRIADTATSLELSPEQAAAIRARADKRLAALGDIFPDGSWERDDPIVLESRQMRLLFKQYHSLPDGRVNLVPCTLVMLPDRNRSADGEAGGRTIVLRAPQGAVLEFDEPLDLRQGRLAKLVGGSLRGQVTIRGTATGPDADDEIEIVTRDVELAELEIRTSEMVQFRYGRSTGSGRALVAALLPKAGGAGSGASGPNIGGVDSLRLDRDVRMRLEGFSAGLLSGPDAPRPMVTGTAGPDAEQPPVLVSCRGALCMNVSANVITFEDKVEVVRTAADGATDQLSCDLLAIMLARGEADPRRGAAGGGLKPVEIQARGTPVIARSTAAKLEAKGARLGYEISTRRILLDGEESVSLVLERTEMQARSIDYCPGPPGDPGSLMAVGPGLLKTQSPGSPPVQARWQKWLRMRPDGAGHVASLAGEADVMIEGQGRLSAAEMHLWLDVDRGTVAAPRRSNAAGPHLAGVKPARMLARGLVEIDTEPLTARTERMELWFKHVAATAATTPVPVAAVVAAPPGPTAAGGRGPQPAAPAKAAESSLPTRGKMIATGGLIRGLISMAPDNNQIDEISLENQVQLVEEPRGPTAAAPAEPSLAISGDQLQLSRPTRFDARAVVSGRPAKVQGRGLELEGPLVEFDRGRNRLLVDGAGTLGLPMTSAASGFESLGMIGGAAPPAAPAAGDPAGRLVVAWQGRMDFDGQTARFVDRVTTTSGATALHAGSLDVVFTQPMDFSAEGMQRGTPRTDVARIGCGSGVRIESQSAAADGSRSLEKLFVRDLVLDRATGDVSGTGPGRLTSTRFGQGPALAMPAVAAPGQPAPAAAAPPPRPDELTYLGVDFQKGLRGNMNRRQMEFHQRVEAIWGPVAGWGDTLDPHAPGGLAPRAVAITSDVLGVAQAPPAPGQRRSSIELMAGGNVLVEGESFTARSARLSWSEAKDLLVFEGDGRSDAQLFRQVKVGAPMSSASAGKILYWRALNRVDVDDARFLDLDQLGGGGTAPRLPGFGSAPAQPVSRPLPGT